MFGGHNAHLHAIDLQRSIKIVKNKLKYVDRAVAESLSGRTQLLESGKIFRVTQPNATRNRDLNNTLAEEIHSVRDLHFTEEIHHLSIIGELRAGIVFVGTGTPVDRFAFLSIVLGTQQEASLPRFISFDQRTFSFFAFLGHFCRCFPVQIFGFRNCWLFIIFNVFVSFKREVKKKVGS